jgi:hypothetical protein
MKRDNRSAAASVFILEMFSVMLLSALLVGMMMSESTAAQRKAPRACRPANKCGGCTIDSNFNCRGMCVKDPNCSDCLCETAKGSFPKECWCQ